ncbi:MAG: YceD family protein [Psychrobacter sp.]|nr:YceD family protein [Psychrobacter sp.]
MSIQPQNLQATLLVAMPSTLPNKVSLDKWADTGFTWQGTIQPNDFTRLKAVLTPDYEQSAIEVKVQLTTVSNVLELSFQLVGQIWMTCQRCLQPIAIDLTDDYHIELLEEESQAKMLDEDDDYLLLDEVVEQEGHETYLPLARLIEDEILLQAPLSPKHDDCEMILDQVGEIEEIAEESPFAALAALKGKL